MSEVVPSLLLQIWPRGGSIADKKFDLAVVVYFVEFKLDLVHI